MSTRSNIYIKDGQDGMILYRHSDGYPTGQESLLKFMEKVKKGEIRSNVSQSVGWLIIIGHKEYEEYRNNEITNWKVGAYEPYHWGMDIEWFYILDLEKKKIKVFTANIRHSDEPDDKGRKITKEGLRDERNIKMCIDNGYLEKVGEITEFDDVGVLKKIEEKRG